MGSPEGAEIWGLEEFLKGAPQAITNRNGTSRPRAPGY